MCIPFHMGMFRSWLEWLESRLVVYTSKYCSLCKTKYTHPLLGSPLNFHHLNWKGLEDYTQGLIPWICMQFGVTSWPCLPKCSYAVVPTMENDRHFRFPDTNTSIRHITQSAQDKCMDRYKTSVRIPFITFKNRLSHDITTAMYNSVLTHITMSAQDRCVDRYKTSTVCWCCL